MKNFAVLLGLVLALSFSNIAWAITLDEAKAQGLVGERVDGFIGAVVANPAPEVEALITTTNEGRRQVYLDLATRNGITVEEVGIVSGEKLRDKAARGEFVQTPSGQWQRK